MRDIKCSQEAREKCPFDHPCDSDEAAYFEEGSPCDQFNKKLMPPPPQTNADHLRSMTDEELAEFIPNWSYTGACKCDEHYVDCNNECEKCVAEWLKQPYKEESTNA